MWIGLFDSKKVAISINLTLLIVLRRNMFQKDTY